MFLRFTQKQSVSETNPVTVQRHFILFVLNLPMFSSVLKGRSRKGRLIIKVQKSREMRCAVHKASYAGMSVILGQGWRTKMFVAAGESTWTVL